MLLPIPPLRLLGRLVLPALSLLLVLMLPLIVAAQEVAAPPTPPSWVVWIKAVAEPLIEPVALILSGVALILAKRFAKWLAVKLDVEDAHALSLIEEQVTKVVDGGISYAEQLANGWTRERGALPTQAQKLQWAVDWIVREAKRRGLPELARDALVDLIESRLGDPKAPGDADRAGALAARLRGAEIDG